MSGRFRLVVAVIIATCGIALVVATFMPSRGIPTPHADAPTGSMWLQSQLPQFSLAVHPTLDTQVNAQTVAAVASTMAERIRAQIDADASMSALGEEMTARLVSATREQAEIYLGGNYEKYERWLERSGARRGYIEGEAARGPEAVAEAERRYRASWEGNGANIALKPVGVHGVNARIRFLNGKERPTGDDWHVGIVRTAPDRWPALAGDPRTNGYTIVEVMYPVFYVDTEAQGPPVSGPVYFAIWFVWDSRAKDWRLHQTRLYNPLKLGVAMCPAI